jgi:hypothetical protein
MNMPALQDLNAGMFFLEAPNLRLSHSDATETPAMRRSRVRSLPASTAVLAGACPHAALGDCSLEV